MEKAPEYKEVEVVVEGFDFDPETNFPVVLLKNIENTHRIPIWINQVMAEMIYAGTIGIKYLRPTIFDLLKSIVEEDFGGSIEKAVITEIKDTIYHAVLHLRKPGGELKIRDCRSTDALVIALRASCPIYMEQKLFQEYSIPIEPPPVPEEKPVSDVSNASAESTELDIANMPTHDVEKMKKIFDKMDEPPDKDKFS